eukprot:3433227-Pleurochrysis_carterae.AAC.1
MDLKVATSIQSPSFEHACSENNLPHAYSPLNEIRGILLRVGGSSLLSNPCWHVYFRPSLPEILSYLPLLTS